MNTKTMKTPIISIILPVYNAERFISESIESILEQTFTDYELIIINDGSTDNTINIINSYSDNRIKLISKPHNYIESLNIGFKHAKGRYTARMDADDIMLPHRLETQYNFMENNPDIDICGGWVQTFGLQDTQYTPPLKHETIIAGLLFGNQINHPTVILRSDKLRSLSHYPDLYNPGYIYAEDYKLWVDLAIQEFRFANLPDVVVKYRKTASQITTQYQEQVSAKRTKIKTEYLEHILEKITQTNPDLFTFVDEAIDFFNNHNLSISTLTNIVYDLFQTQLDEQRHKDKP